MGAGASSAGVVTAIEEASHADVNAYLASWPRDERKKLEGCFATLEGYPEASEARSEAAATSADSTSAVPGIENGAVFAEAASAEHAEPSTAWAPSAPMAPAEEAAAIAPGAQAVSAIEGGVVTEAAAEAHKDSSTAAPAETIVLVASAEERNVPECANISKQDMEVDAPANVQTAVDESSIAEAAPRVHTDSSAASAAAEAGVPAAHTESSSPAEPQLDANPSIAAHCGEDALCGVKLEMNGKQLQYISHRPMEADRLKVMSDHFPECKNADQVFAVEAQREDGSTRELVAVVQEGSGVLITDTCLISFVELSPSESVEYAFAEAPDHWAIAKLSRDALESYRSLKFGQWKELLLKGECEAQLRRMLQAGVISRIYDEHVFPTPEEYKSLYQVRCEKTGQLVSIPHPVSSLRIWDATAASYASIDAQLAGAPVESDKDKFWSELFADIRRTRGEEYIDSLLASEASSQ